MPPAQVRSVDMHMHVAVLGVPGSSTGFMSKAMQISIPFKIFLLYARIPANDATDARPVEIMLEGEPVCSAASKRRMTRVSPTTLGLRGAPWE